MVCIVVYDYMHSLCVFFSEHIQDLRLLVC